MIAGAVAEDDVVVRRAPIGIEAEHGVHDVVLPEIVDCGAFVRGLVTVEPG